MNLEQKKIKIIFIACRKTINIFQIINMAGVQGILLLDHPRLTAAIFTSAISVIFMASGSSPSCLMEGHSIYTASFVLSVTNLYCSFWPKISTDNATQAESVQSVNDFCTYTCSCSIINFNRTKIVHSPLQSYIVYDRFLLESKKH